MNFNIHFIEMLPLKSQIFIVGKTAKQIPRSAIVHAKLKIERCFRKKKLTMFAKDKMFNCVTFVKYYNLCRWFCCKKETQ